MRLSATIFLLAIAGSGAAFAEGATKVRLMDYFYPARTRAVWNYLTSNADGGYDASVLKIVHPSHEMSLFRIEKGVLVEKRKSVMWMHTVVGRYEDGKITARSILLSNDFYGKGPGFGLYGIDDIKKKQSMSFSSGLEFPENLAINQPVSVKSNTFDWDGRQGPDATMKAEVLGRTKLTVPAGTFSDCIHLRFTFSVKGEPATTREEWWARGVGMIRSKGIDGKGKSAITKMHSYEIPYPVTIAFWNSHGNFGLTSTISGGSRRVMFVKNNGTKSIRPPTISLSGSKAFECNLLTSGKVLPGEVARIEVLFRPQGMKGYKATLKAEDRDNPKNACIMQLTGNGGW